MLHLGDIDRIARTAAARVVGEAVLARASSEPEVASGGEDALRIRLVFHRDLNPAADGHVALDTIVGVRQALIDAGEDRVPIVSFSNEAEEALDVDAPS